MQCRYDAAHLVSVTNGSACGKPPTDIDHIALISAMTDLQSGGAQHQHQAIDDRAAVQLCSGAAVQHLGSVAFDMPLDDESGWTPPSYLLSERLALTPFLLPSFDNPGASGARLGTRLRASERDRRGVTAPNRQRHDGKGQAPRTAG
jgi:hypothetical protein